MAGPSSTVDQNILPVQAYFNIDGSFNTFIGQGQPFVISATESIGIINTSVNGTFYPTFSLVNSGQVTSLDVTSSNYTWNPGTGVLSAPFFSGTLNGTATATTSIANGASSQVLYQISPGVTGFIPNGASGQFLVSNGTNAPSWATVATSVNIADQTSSSSTFYPLFYSATSGSTNTVETSSTKLQYIPSSGTLISTIFSGSGASLTNIPNSALTNSSFTLGSTAISLGNTVTTVAGLTSVTSTTFVGALTGNASTATLSTNATNTAITDNTSSSATWYPTIVSNSTGNLPITTSSAKLSFVPSTGTLTATTFSGAATNLSGGLAGYLPYQTAVNTTTFLAPGTNGYVLTLASGVPTWAASSGGVTTFSAGTTGFTPSSATSGAITLAGTLAIANGGTNATATPTAGAVAYGNGTAYAFTAAGTTGQALLSNGSSAPTWGTPTAGAGGSTTQVQYNNAGVLAGSANMTFSGTALTLANDANINSLGVGRGAGSIITNAVLGAAAFGSNTTGSNNVAIGYTAFLNNTTGGNSVAIGSGAFTSNITGGNTIAIGANALNSNITGNTNIAIGNTALQSNTTNLVIGAIAGGQITGGSGYTNGTYTAVALSRSSGSTASTYGTATVVVSSGAVSSVTIVTGGTGYKDATTVLTVSNTLLGGAGSGFSFTLIAGNLASGGGNTAIGGTSCMSGNTVGSNNTAVGTSSLQFNTTGSSNNGFARTALNANTTGSNNNAFGNSALSGVTTGSNNTGIGNSAGPTLTTGSNNTYLGAYANASGAAVTNEIAIGYNQTGLGNNTTVIGNSSTTLTKAFGVIVGTNYTVATLPSASTSGVGARSFVTDALAPVFGSTVAGSGAVATPVYSDGTNWKVG